MQKPLPPPKETRPTTPIVQLVVGGIVMVALAGLAVAFLLPFLILLLPLILIFVGIVAWALVSGEQSTRKAQSRAAARLDKPGTTGLQVVETAGLASTLVINDWGLVYQSPGKASIEVRWNEVSLVEEPEPKILRISTHGQRHFDVDLSIMGRYFLVARVMYEKLPHCTEFDINPITGKSLLLPKLSKRARKWTGLWGQFIVDDLGVERNGKRISWDAIGFVKEIVLGSNREPGTFDENWHLVFASNKERVEIEADKLGRGYGVLKSIIQERLPAESIKFEEPAFTPSMKAMAEFSSCQQLMEAPFTLGRKSRNFTVVEPYFAHMLYLVDQFSLTGPHVQKFFSDYVELLQATGHLDEAQVMEKRAAC